MQDERIHKVLHYDWPQVPRNAPTGSSDVLEVDLAGVVREVLQTVRQDGSSAPAERWVRIRNFRSERYVLTDDLVVMIEEMPDEFIARSYDTGQYGCGVSADDAIESLCVVLEEYYEILQQDRGNLSRPLESHLRYLDSVLRAVHVSD